MKAILCSLTVIVLLFEASPPLAAGEWRSLPAKHFVQLERRERAEPRISVEQAIDLVQRRTAGRVLAAQTVRLDGRPGYRIKVLTRRGEVQEVYVDAETGEIR